MDVSEDTVECIWRSSHFRAAIRRKFDEVIVEDKTGSGDSRTIEEQLFAKAKTKDEYLEMSARVIIHYKQLIGQTNTEEKTRETTKGQDTKQVDDITQEKYKLKRKSIDQEEPSNSAKKCKIVL